MNKFEKIYNEYIERPVLKIDDKVIDLYVDREDFLDLLEYGKKLEQVLDKIKEKLKEKDENGFEKIYVEDAIIFIDELLEKIE